MLYLARRIGLLSLMVLATFVIIMVGTPKDRTGYYASFGEKFERLHIVKPPRLIMVGGSNVAMGIESEILEKRLRITPVNMGINGGVGLRFMLDNIKPLLRPGDVAVIIPEYEQLTSIFNGDINLARYLSASPGAWRGLRSYKQVLVILYHLPQLVQIQFWEWIRSLGGPLVEPVYSARAYNRFGDMVSHLGRTSPRDMSTARILTGGKTRVDAEALRELEEFNLYAKQRGITSLITFPSLTVNAYKDQHRVIGMIYERIKSGTTIPVISKPEENTYPSELFYDTAYHLNEKGRSLRTEQLARELASVP